MLRRLLIPITLLVVVAGVGTMCTALTGASAKRKLQQRAQRGSAMVEVLPTPDVPDSARSVRADAPGGACSGNLPDASQWTRVLPEGSAIDIPLPPGFDIVSQGMGQGPDMPFLVVRASNGDEFRLTRSSRPYHGTDVAQYASSSSCRRWISEVLTDIETGRDTWRAGNLKIVIASYALGTTSFIAFHGTAETAERQAQMLAAVHNARFRGR